MGFLGGLAQQIGGRQADQCGDGARWQRIIKPMASEFQKVLGLPQQHMRRQSAQEQ